ncbi:CLE25p like [Actinidia chinensis var. chinensis]|uniref:CLE25p like n=1 Tax=Actinidia chinensis var. chinensis TaxID=1590841 RepID=A0A2R6QY18_ACTCC|nr:CLE25p like [Actinidia chinensis var. chinensis]
MQLKVVLLFLLLVSVESKDNMINNGMNRTSLQSQEKLEPKQEAQKQLRHSMGLFFASKRRVPNASDPLHNR